MTANKIKTHVRMQQPDDDRTVIDGRTDFEGFGNARQLHVLVIGSDDPIQRYFDRMMETAIDK